MSYQKAICIIKKLFNVVLSSVDNILINLPSTEADCSPENRLVKSFFPFLKDRRIVFILFKFVEFAKYCTNHFLFVSSLYLYRYIICHNRQTNSLLKMNSECMLIFTNRIIFQKRKIKYGYIEFLIYYHHNYEYQIIQSNC